MALEAEELGDQAGFEEKTRGEFGEIDATVGRHDAVEVEREILVRGVGDGANGGAGNFFAETELPDDVGFHFDGVHAGDLPEFEFFIGGAGDAVGEFKARELAFGGEKGFFPGRAFVHVVNDGGEFESWVQAAGETVYLVRLEK